MGRVRMARLLRPLHPVCYFGMFVRQGRLHTDPAESTGLNLVYRGVSAYECNVVEKKNACIASGLRKRRSQIPVSTTTCGRRSRCQPRAAPLVWPLVIAPDSKFQRPHDGRPSRVGATKVPRNCARSRVKVARVPSLPGIRLSCRGHHGRGSSPRNFEVERHSTRDPHWHRTR